MSRVCLLSETGTRATNRRYLQSSHSTDRPAAVTVVLQASPRASRKRWNAHELSSSQEKPASTVLRDESIVIASAPLGRWLSAVSNMLAVDSPTLRLSAWGD